MPKPPRFLRRFITPDALYKLEAISSRISNRGLQSLQHDIATSASSIDEAERRSISPTIPSTSDSRSTDIDLGARGSSLHAGSSTTRSQSDQSRNVAYELDLDRRRRKLAQQRELHTANQQAREIFNSLKASNSSVQEQSSRENHTSSMPETSESGQSTLKPDDGGQASTTNSPFSKGTQKQKKRAKKEKLAERQKEAKEAMVGTLGSQSEKRLFRKARRKLEQAKKKGARSSGLETHNEEMTIGEGNKSIQSTKWANAENVRNSASTSLGRRDGSGETQGPDSETSADTRDQPPHVGVQTSNVEESLVATGRLTARDILIEAIDDGLNKPIARLRKNLQRVPFNPGIHTMRDPRTGVWNFDPEHLHEIPTPSEFAFDRTPGYLPPGQDPDLLDVASKHGIKYLGSTSTLTKSFSQIYFALSGNRGLDMSPFSQPFLVENIGFTPSACLPATLKIHKGTNGHVFIDNDKSGDTPNVLTRYGVVLEKMLTVEPDDFQRFLLTSPDSGVTQEERSDRGAYQYSKIGKMLMRSQLDCQDPRLPGKGVFDIKTRACLSIRYDVANYDAMSRYDIAEERGYLHSFEREYFDMTRSTLLKYAMQVRIGMMDGIFVAYHNVNRIFGFQYISKDEMDRRLHGSSEMGDAAFKYCVVLFETLMDHILECFPDQKVLVTIKQTRPLEARTVRAFVQPEEWDGPENQRPVQEIKLRLKSFIDGQPEFGAIGLSPIESVRREQNWSVNWTITKSTMEESVQKSVRKRLSDARRDLDNMAWVNLPEGKTIKEMETWQDPNLDLASHEVDVKWKLPDSKTRELRQVAKSSGEAYLERASRWREQPGNSWETI